MIALPTPSTSSLGYMTGPNTKAPDWHALVAWDVLLNGLSTGLFVVAAVAELAAPARFTPLAQAAYTLALLLIIADLIFLVLDLGDPWRFHHMLRVFKPSSPMSLGTWCLSVYSMLLTVLVGLDWLAPAGTAVAWVRWIVLLVALPPALGSAIYKGVLFSTTAQPGWKDARWFGAYLANSALVLGSAEMVLLAFLLAPERLAFWRTALEVLLAVNLVVLALLFAELRPTLVSNYHPRDLQRLMALGLGGTILLPLVLLPLSAGYLTVALAGLITLGGMLVRSAIVDLPHATHRAASKHISP